MVRVRPQFSDAVARRVKFVGYGVTGFGAANSFVDAFSLYKDWNVKYQTAGQKAGAMANFGIGAVSVRANPLAAGVLAAMAASSNVLFAFGSEDYNLRGQLGEAAGGNAINALVAGAEAGLKMGVGSQSAAKAVELGAAGVNISKSIIDIIMHDAAALEQLAAAGSEIVLKLGPSEAEANWGGSDVD
jgi:hypothetical protein